MADTVAGRLLAASTVILALVLTSAAGATALPAQHRAVPAIHGQPVDPAAAAEDTAPWRDTGPELEEWSFVVWLDDERVGGHRLSVVRTQGKARVQSVPDQRVHGLLEQIPLFASGQVPQAFARWQPELLTGQSPQADDPEALFEAEPLGLYELEVAGIAITTQRFRVEAEQAVFDLWYAQDSGRWLGLKGITDSGQELRYELRSYRLARPGSQIRI